MDSQGGGNVCFCPVELSKFWWWSGYSKMNKWAKKHHNVAVVVEWLACLPVTQKIGVHFYLERESSATSDWINVGREWCCRGWGVNGGTSGGLFRTWDGPRIKKAQPLTTSMSVRVCMPDIKTLYLRRNGCHLWMLVCVCVVFHCVCICMCSLYSN